ncbi:MAG: hypothetical protein J6C28_07390 [Bacilli bacterium]|nr:hypothetical protein [Bacilli bacterium]
MEKLDKLKKGLFVWSSSLILIFAVYKFVELIIYFDFEYFLNYLPSLVYYGAMIALGIFLAARKNSLPISISLLIIALVEGYWMVMSVISLVKSDQLFSFYGFIWVILYVLRLISPTMLAVISFADWKKIWDKIKKLWVIPAVGTFVYFIIYLAYYVVGYIGYDLSNLFLSLGIELLYYIGFVMFTLTFANLDNLKKLLNKTKGL